MTNLSDVVPGGAGRAIRELRFALPGEALIGANQGEKMVLITINKLFSLFKRIDSRPSTCS